MVGKMLTLFFFFAGCRLAAHVSAVLHALVAMTAKNFQVQPALPSTPSADEKDEVMPVTSYLCQWKVPKKESNLPMSAAVFENHDYQKQKKRRISITEDFVPRPMECRGTAQSLLPALLDSIRGESLGVSVLFDPKYCHQTMPVTHPDVPATSAIKKTVEAFKESLRMPAAKLQEIEQNTPRTQRDSPLWFSVRRYRITASRFGEILHRRTVTRPDKLVLSLAPSHLLQQIGGVQKESLVIQEYISFQHEHGRDKLTVAPCGFLVCESYPFSLGLPPMAPFMTRPTHNHR